MLTALGTFLDTITAPLTAMGTQMSLNLQTYAAVAPSLYQGRNMSTIAFNIFAGEWINALGSISIGAATFLSSVVDFLQGLVGLL